MGSSGLAGERAAPPLGRPGHGRHTPAGKAQEGRAWARLGRARETHETLNRLMRLVEPLHVPDRAEHHYRYDPAKSDAYLATTLCRLGDPSAEPYSRGVLARLESATDGPPRPRGPSPRGSTWLSRSWPPTSPTRRGI
ncbi:hypothetical protein ACFYUK_38725 [Nonomuraea wenchangensis]